MGDAASGHGSQSRPREVLPGTPITYAVEARMDLSFGSIEVLRYHWNAPIDRELAQPDGYFALNLALSPRPAPGRLERLGEDRPGDPEQLGRVMAIGPGCTFRLSVPTGSVRSLQCMLSRRKLEDLAGGPVDFSAGRRLRLGQSGPVIEMLLNRIYEELRDRRREARTAIEAYATALCVELARCLREGAAAGQAGCKKGGLPPWRMRLIGERIHAEAPAPNLEELAALCGMTVRQLSRAFKVETGQTLGRHIDEAMHERACRLLANSDFTIVEIAGRLGFASAASFSYAFRRASGILPSDYRRRTIG